MTDPSKTYEKAKCERGQHFRTTKRVQATAAADGSPH